MKEEAHLMRRIAILAGSLVAIGGLTLFAVAIMGGGADVHAGEDGTTTATAPAGTATTAAGTRTPGPLTPVSTPTISGGAGGATSTPAAGGGAQLPETGTGAGADGGSGMALIAALGAGLALLGGTAVFAGTRRRA
jgi:hypothetical protein